MTGTEHILLALLREGENVGLRLLNTIGINVQKGVYGHFDCDGRGYKPAQR